MTSKKTLRKEEGSAQHKISQSKQGPWNKWDIGLLVPYIGLTLEQKVKANSTESFFFLE